MDMANLINRNQGVLSLISFLATFALVVVWVTTVRADISDVKQSEDQQVIILQLISDSLKEKTRDHLEFSRSSERTNEILSDMTVVLAKLEVTLNNLDRKIE